jgi:hypothetical protein
LGKRQEKETSANRFGADLFVKPLDRRAAAKTTPRFFGSAKKLASFYGEFWMF